MGQTITEKNKMRLTKSFKIGPEKLPTAHVTQTTLLNLKRVCLRIGAISTGKVEHHRARRTRLNATRCTLSVFERWRTTALTVG